MCKLARNLKPKQYNQWSLDGKTRQLTISVFARAIAVVAVVDETAIALREKSVALLHEHAVVAVSRSANGRSKLLFVTIISGWSTYSV